MPKLFVRLFALVFFAVFVFSEVSAAVGVDAENEAKAWLTAAQQATSKLNYRGIVSYMKDNQIESLHVFHGFNNGVEQERLLSVNTPMREVIRTADKVTCYYPESKSMSVDAKPSRHSMLLNLPSNLGELSKHYVFSLGEVEHVARRPARIVTITAKDATRYGRKLWIDVESRLPLKLEWLDGNGQVLEETVFSSLTVEASIPQSELVPSTQADDSWKIKRHETLPADLLRWTLDNVPDGFHMMSYTRLKRDANNRVIDHILLSDGISSVSIYIDELMNEVFTAQPRKIGAINSYTRKLDKYLITVMGEAPEKTVQIIGDGIHLQDSSRQ
jgi:sigma-E factor negative regulatory protein RseB